MAKKLQSQLNEALESKVKNRELVRELLKVKIYGDEQSLDTLIENSKKKLKENRTKLIELKKQSELEQENLELEYLGFKLDFSRKQEQSADNINHVDKTSKTDNKKTLTNLSEGNIPDNKEVKSTETKSDVVDGTGKDAADLLEKEEKNSEPNDLTPVKDNDESSLEETPNNQSESPLHEASDETVVDGTGKADLLKNEEKDSKPGIQPSKFTIPKIIITPCSDSSDDKDGDSSETLNNTKTGLEPSKFTIPKIIITRSSDSYDDEDEEGDSSETLNNTHTSIEPSKFTIPQIIVTPCSDSSDDEDEDGDCAETLNNTKTSLETSKFTIPKIIVTPCSDSSDDEDEDGDSAGSVTSLEDTSITKQDCGIESTTIHFPNVPTEVSNVNKKNDDSVKISSDVEATTVTSDEFPQTKNDGHLDDIVELNNSSLHAKGKNKSTKEKQKKMKPEKADEKLEKKRRTSKMITFRERNPKQRNFIGDLFCCCFKVEENENLDEDGNTLATEKQHFVS